MYELKTNGKVFMSKFVGIGPPSYEKRNYQAAVSRRLRNAGLEFLGIITFKGRCFRGNLTLWIGNYTDQDQFYIITKKKKTYKSPPTKIV